MKSTYSWDAENSVVAVTIAETKTLDDVCRVLTKHGPSEIADRFIEMCCIVTGYEEVENEWYRLHSKGDTEARDSLESEYPWLSSYRGVGEVSPPGPIYSDRQAFIDAHVKQLRGASYAPFHEQMNMQKDDARDNGTRWLDHCSFVEATFPDPAE